MLAKVFSVSLSGMDGTLISVEVDVSMGLPAWEIVGLPDTTVREAKERVRSAIKNSDFELPSRRIIINMAPADTKKEGSSFDLAIAVGVLKSLDKIFNSLNDFVFIGELSLDGNINRVNGVLPMCVEAKKLGINNIVVPYDNRFEASVVAGINIYPMKTLKDLVSFLNDSNEKIPFIVPTNFDDIEENFDIDFSDVRGQEGVKRAFEIAASGGHNLLLIGSPRFRKNNAF